MKRVKKYPLREEQVRGAPEESVRRLARYCEVAGWDTLPVSHLIEELGWKGYVAFTVPRGSWY